MDVAVVEAIILLGAAGDAAGFPLGGQGEDVEIRHISRWLIGISSSGSVAIDVGGGTLGFPCFSASCK
jgi:hypothetical protein